ncbi:MAG: hypothetical protein QXI58_01635 [Candidatus Micrarchaeia archaeon]
MKFLIDTFRIYKKNLSMILFFSIPFIISLVAQLLAPAPIYLALGGYFLRTGSLPKITLSDILVIFLTSAISLFFLCLALASITLVVKATKTRTKISSEVLEDIGLYTFAIFAVFLAVKIIEMLIILLSIQIKIDETLALICSFILSLGLFYTAPGIVLEEKRPIRAFFESYVQIARKPLHFVFWLVFAFVLLSLVTFIIYQLVSEAIVRQILVLLINSLFIAPILIILQAQIYLMKYTIIER